MAYSSTQAACRRRHGATEHQDQLQRLGRGDADLGTTSAGVHLAGRVESRVATHEERFLRSAPWNAPVGTAGAGSLEQRAAPSARAPVVGLERHPLHLCQEARRSMIISRRTLSCR